MKFTTTPNTADKLKTECLVIGVFEDKKPSLQSDSLNKETTTYLQKILKLNDLQGKTGQTQMLYHVPGLAAERVLLVGCGKKAKLNEANYKKILAAMTTSLRQTQVSDASCYLTLLPIKNRDAYWMVRFAIETISHQNYEFNQFKSQKPSATPLASIKLAIASKSEQALAESAINVASAIADATKLCRDLSNMPSNICNPTYMANQAKALAKALPATKLKVLEEADMEKLGMNCILAVGRGSNEPSKFLEMHYQGGDKNAAPIVLVGKGITFDTGGVCIKTAANMFDMKMDMTGASTMLAVLTAAANLRLPLNIVALLPCVENMADGKSYKPSDVLTSMSGKTVEVIDTDAEGRLILCDALTYAERFKPSVVIDAATLTGAVVVALGHHFTAVFSNDNKLSQTLLSAGKRSHDLCWEMPMCDEYQAQLDSKIADMTNLAADRTAGSAMGACFLARFTENYTWAHLDIAGTSMHKSACTGRPVAMLVEYLLDLAKQSHG